MKLLPYVFKNALRNKMRTVLTIGSIALSLGLMATLYAYTMVQDEIGVLAERSDRLVVQHAQSLTMPVPIAHLDRIRAMEDVVEAVQLSWFGGQHGDERIPFPQFGTDPARVLTVLDEVELPEAELRAWQADRTGCVAGRKAAESRGWKIGDRIRLKGILFPVDLQLTLRGIFDGPDETQLWFHWKYVDELLRAELGSTVSDAGTIWIKGRNRAALPGIMEAVDGRFANSEFPTRTMTEKAFNQMFLDMIGNVKGFIRNIGLAVVFTLMLVAANTMAMSVRERVTEIAVLKALGFRRGQVLGLILGEAVLISAVGGLLGVGGAKLLFQAVDISGFMFVPYFYVPPATLLLGLAAAALIGLASGAVPCWKAASLRVADGLRKVA